MTIDSMSIEEDSMMMTRVFIAVAVLSSLPYYCNGQVYLKCTIAIAEKYTCSRELVTMDPVSTFEGIKPYHIVDSVKVPSSIGTLISYIVEYCDVVDEIRDGVHDVSNRQVKPAIDNSPGDTISCISGDTTFTIVLKEVYAKWRYQLCYRPYEACDSSLPLVIQHAAYPTELFYCARISRSLFDRIKHLWESKYDAR